MYASRYTTYVSLNHKTRGCVMSNTQMEMFTNQKFLNVANGDILIAGLGIGMLPAALAQKDDVKSITIIELDSEIIGLIEPLIRKYVPNNDKIKIIHADAYTYAEQYGQNKQYDYVWLDIWDTFPNSDMYDEINELVEKFIPICPNNQIQFWGDEFVECGLDEIPTETEAFCEYIHNSSLNQYLEMKLQD